MDVDADPLVDPHLKDVYGAYAQLGAGWADLTHSLKCRFAVASTMRLAFWTAA